MSSSQAPRWKRWLYRGAPFLFKQCPEGNYHWKWHALCFCRSHDHSGDWHGGMMTFKDGKEWINEPEHSRALYQWVIADNFICACDALKNHKEQCWPCCRNEPCRKAREFARKLEECGFKYYSHRRRLTGQERQRPWGVEAI